MNIMHVFGGNPAQVKQFINHNDWSFVENKGQLADDKGNLITDVKFYSHEGGAHIYCRPVKISFVFTKIDNEQKQVSEATGTYSGFPLPNGAGGFGRKNNNPPSKITTNRIDLILLNSNPSAIISPSDQQEYYENFYLAHTPEEGITNVRTYKTITYKNIYPNIDIVLHSKESGMKYEFVVYPGGKVSDIQLQWNGLQNIKKEKDNGIEYLFPLENMTETAPYTYTANVGAGFTPALFVDKSHPVLDDQITQGDRKGSPYIKTNTQIIESSFVLKNNQIGFKVGNYDKRKVLVIDPYLEWGTYFGGGADEVAYGIATDLTGNAIISGYAESTSGIASNGAYQSSSGGNHDIFIAKFSTNGFRLWSTYYGGENNDVAWAIATDISGNVYITGRTQSLNGISTKGSYQPNFSGGLWDAFVAKFSSIGSKIWSTYYGMKGQGPNGSGGQNDGYGITSDVSGNVIIVGTSDSKTGFGSSGTYQLHSGGGFDAFIAKFSGNGNRIWGTYFGGNSTELATGIIENTNNDIFIIGSTVSNSGISSSGAYQKSLNGVEDAFLAKFSSSGNLIWSTYFGGSGEEWAHSIVIDNLGNLNIVGETRSSSGIASIGAYQTSLRGFEDAFIAKFTNSGNLIWSTYFGGESDEHGTGIAIDTSKNLIITGATWSKTGISTKDAFELNYVGFSMEAYIAKFSSSGNRIWGSYLGNSGSESQCIAADTSGNFYLTGVTESSPKMITTGTYQTVYGGNGDAFVVKFGPKPVYDIGIPGLESDSVCPNENSFITSKLKNYGTDTFISATINWTVNGILQDSVLWTGKILPDSIQPVELGSYEFLKESDTIVAWSRLNNAKDLVPENDTSYIIIHFYKKHFTGVGQKSYSICNGAHIRIGTNGSIGNKYFWTSDPKGFISTFPNPIVNPDSFTTFYLTETNTRTGCLNTDSSTVKVNVVKAPVADAGKSHIICKGDSTFVGSSFNSNLTYLWSSIPGGFSSTRSNFYVKPSLTTIYTVQVTNSTGCSDINDDTITVNAPLALTGLPQSICTGSVIALGSEPIAGHRYSWKSIPAGFTSSLSNPIDSPNITTIYYLNESVILSGCSNTDSVLITVIPRPIVKIQTDSFDAFTRKFSALNPNYPANMYKWKISDGDTSSGYSITHTFKNEGNYTAKLSVSIPGFCVDSDSVKVDVHPPFSLNIFPNPYSINADIRYILVNPAHIKIMIFDMLGRQITTLVDTHLEVGEYNTPINAPILKTRPDMYLVVFMIDDKIITKKVVQLDSIYY